MLIEKLMKSALKLTDTKTTSLAEVEVKIEATKTMDNEKLNIFI